MADGVNILVGTVGQGVMRSPDGGETWQRAGISQGLHSDAIVRCLSNHSSRPEVVLAGRWPQERPIDERLRSGR